MCVLLKKHLRILRVVISIKNQKIISAFGKNLKSIRLEKGFSQEYLANLADIPINQIGRIERGEVNTTISTIYAISQALKIDVKDLFVFAEKKK